MMDAFSALSMDSSTGKLFWANPPKEHAEKIGREAGYILKANGNNKAYWQIRIGGKTYKRSRVVYYITHGRWPMPCVDHINGNSLDDRPLNLREVTLAQNSWNLRPRAKKASGLPQGVSKYRDGYRAVITKLGERTVLGCFPNPELASAAYQAARKEVFGEYA